MTEREDDLDELLQATVMPVARSGNKPWRVQSQFWVAFFGGILAVTGIAYLNSRHLGASPSTRRLILACGVLALAIYVALAGWVFLNEPRNMRIGGRILAVVLFLGLARLQREGDARHQLFASGEYAPLWGAGITASVLGNLALAGIVFALYRTLK
jgi:hypothetical protein